jgi:hypothetical protein
VAQAMLTYIIALLFNVMTILNVMINSSSAQLAQLSGAPRTAFHTLKIGAGGFIHNLDIQCDQGVGACSGSGTTTKVVRTDTYGAYWFNPAATGCGNTPLSGCWQQIITANFHDSLFPNAGGSLGVYEIRIAPSNTAHFYMYHANGYVYSSTDHGTTWTRTAFYNVPTKPGDETGTDNFAPYMAVDPANENVLIVGTPSSGVFYTTDGGTTFNSISTGTIPGGTTGGALAEGGGNLIAFDPTSSVSGRKTQGIYITSYGHGVYHTTGGTGGSWSLLNTSGMPTTFQHLFIDQNGNVWIVDNPTSNGLATNLNKYASGSWSQPLPHGSAGGNGTLNAVTVDPANANNVVADQPDGTIDSSTDGGGSWTTPNGAGCNTRTATDIPWLGNTNENYMSAGNIMYDPAQSGVLYFAEGIGVWHTTDALSVSRCQAWTSQSAAIEQLVAIWIVSPNTPGAYPIISAMDRAAFQVTSPTQVYPSHHSVNDDAANAIIEGYSVDWCSSAPGTIVLLANGGNGTEYSGLSTTGGVYNSWTLFTSLGTPPSQSATLFSGGAIACATPSKIVWELGNSGGLYYTANGGATWSASSTGLSQNDPGWHGGNFLDRQNVIADRVNTSTFYAYNSGTVAPGVYKSIDGGANFAITQVARHFDNNDRYNAQMRSVPGNGGNFYYTSGNDTPAGTQRFYECTDTNPSGNGRVACAAVPFVTDVWSFGFGKAKPGNSYPAIFIYGEVGGVMGLWRSDDHHSTWTKLSGEFVNNSHDQVRVVEGDNNNYGTVYVGFAGSGFAYGVLH